MAVIYRFVFETEEAMQVPSGQIPVLSYQKKKKKKKKKKKRTKEKITTTLTRYPKCRVERV